VAYHLRRQIREAVATAVTGLTTTGSRVFQSRVYPLEVTDLPCLLVRTEGDASEVQSIHAPSPLMRTLSLQIIATARATADLDDTLDEICRQVEVALAMPCAAIAALSETIALESTTIELQAGAEQPTGSATLQYSIVYFAAENAPDTAL
jgi:hypothetical protein